jgi:hypothetical protein
MSANDVVVEMLRITEAYELVCPGAIDMLIVDAR